VERALTTSDGPLMTTHTQTRSTVAVPRAGRHVGWFALGSFVAFLIPYVGLSVLDLQHDAFYLLYFCVTLALLGTYTRVERIDLRDTFTRNWAWSIGIGVVTAVALWRNVLVNSDATSRPHGAYFAFEVLWRGVGYGIVDALLLTAFPCTVAYAILRGNANGIGGRTRFIALTVPLIWLITATYQRCRALLEAGRGEAQAAEQWAAPAFADAQARGYRWQVLEASRALGMAALLAHQPGDAVGWLRAVWQHTQDQGVEDPLPVADGVEERGDGRLGVRRVAGDG